MSQEDSASVVQPGPLNRQSGVIDNEDRREIVERAFRLLGWLESGRSLSENDIQFGLEVLHCMAIENHLARRIHEIRNRSIR